MTFRRSGKDRTQLGCLGGSVVLLLFGLIKCNEWSFLGPAMEARRVREAVAVGAEWPAALGAAERALPAGRPFLATCRLARGGVVYTGRQGPGYTINSCTVPDRDCYLPSEVTGYRTAGEWEAALREKLLEPRLCQSLVVSINRDSGFLLELDPQQRVHKVTSTR